MNLNYQNERRPIPGLRLKPTLAKPKINLQINKQAKLIARPFQSLQKSAKLIPRSLQTRQVKYESKLKELQLNQTQSEYYKKYPDLAPYFRQILQYMRNKNQIKISQSFKLQPINRLYLSDEAIRMRNTMISYCFDMGYKLDLNRKTIYTAIALSDRYLSITRPSFNKLEMEDTFITCLWISSKMNEYLYPQLYQISLTSSYEKLMLKQKQILQKLNYNLNIQTCYDYCIFYLDFFKLSKATSILSLYILDSIPYNRPLFLKTKPEYLALAVIKMTSQTQNTTLDFNVLQISYPQQKLRSIIGSVFNSYIRKGDYREAIQNYNPMIQSVLKNLSLVHQKQQRQGQSIQSMQALQSFLN